MPERLAVSHQTTTLAHHVTQTSTLRLTGATDMNMIARNLALAVRAEAPWKRAPATRACHTCVPSMVPRTLLTRKGTRTGTHKHANCRWPGVARPLQVPFKKRNSGYKRVYAPCMRLQLHRRLAVPTSMICTVPLESRRVLKKEFRIQARVCAPSSTGALPSRLP